MIFGLGHKGETVATLRGPPGRYSFIFRPEGKAWAADNFRAAANAYFILGEIVLEFDDEEDVVLFKMRV